MQKTSKKTTAARSAEPKQPEPPLLTAREKRLVKVNRHFEAIQEAQAFFAGISSTDLDSLLTFKRILDRNRGCNTPVEEFISHLVWHYGACEDDGKGLTVEQIEADLEGLRDANLPEEIEHAHWMAARYPLPEAKEPEGTA